MQIAYGFVILEIQMAGNQGSAVCRNNNGDQDKSRECRKFSATIVGKKEAQSESDRALNLRRRIHNVFDIQSIDHSHLQQTYRLRNRPTRALLRRSRMGRKSPSRHLLMKVCLHIGSLSKNSVCPSWVDSLRPESGPGTTGYSTSRKFKTII